MKKTAFFVICSLILFVSCDKMFVFVSGKEADLQGKWQMDNADTVYYNFQNSLFQYQIYRKKDTISSVFGYYNLYGDTAIELKLLREYSAIPLDYFGWDTIFSPMYQDAIFKKFTIEKLTSKKLILYSNSGRISFHKF